MQGIPKCVRYLGIGDELADAGGVAGVAFFDHLIDRAVFCHSCCISQSSCHSIHATDVCIEQIVDFEALPSKLGIEIESSWCNATYSQSHVSHSSLLRHHQPCFRMTAMMRVASVTSVKN